MNQYDYYTDITEQFTFPAAPDASSAVATVYFEWGDEIVAETTATLVSGNTYSIDVSAELVDSFGVWRIKWACTIGGTAFYAYTNFKVERPYVSEATFMAAHPEFNTAEYTGSVFDRAERIARAIINTYTGQDFQGVKNKQLVIDGTGKRSIMLPNILNWFTEVLVDDIDYTDAVELDYNSKRYLRLMSDFDVVDGPISITKFPKDIPVYITGDWGWIDIPWQVEEAAILLIIDLLDDTRRENHRYGVSRIWQDTNRIELKDGIFDTTGNTDVDVLIMDFVYWVPSYVS